MQVNKNVAKIEIILQYTYLYGRERVYKNMCLKGKKVPVPVIIYCKNREICTLCVNFKEETCAIIGKDSIPKEEGSRTVC